MQPDRQPGGERDDVAPLEGHDVSGGRPLHRYRGVAGQVVIPPYPQRPRRDEQLHRSRGVDRRQPAGVEPGQQRAPDGEVDGPAVVRIDQRVVPQLGALVDVRYPGHEQLDQLLAERVGPAVPLDPRDERGDVGPQRAVGIDRVD